MYMELDTMNSIWYMELNTMNSIWLGPYGKSSIQAILFLASLTLATIGPRDTTSMALSS